MAIPTPSASTHLAALVEASAALAAIPPAAGPAAVLGALYERVRGLLGVTNFLVSLYDREAELIRCGFAVADGEQLAPDDLPPLPLGSGPVSHVIRTGEPVIVGDTLEERARWNVRVVGGGPESRSMVLAPMTRGGEVVGVVQAQSPRCAAFDADAAAALSVLANQAAAALEAIRQRDEAERAAARARLLDTVSRLLGESLNLPDVLQTLAQQVCAVMGAGCAVVLLHEAGDGYQALAVEYRDQRLASLAAAFGTQAPPPLLSSFLGKLILQGEPVLFADLCAAPLPEALARGAERFGVRGALLAPILRAGQVLGAILVVGTSAYPLLADDLAIATAVAGRAAAAIEHARLHAEVANQRRFLSHLIEAAPIGIAVVRGPELVYEVANAVYRLGAREDEIIGRPFDAVHGVLGTSRSGRARQTLDHVRTTGRPVRLTDLRVERPGRRPRYLSFDISPLPNDTAHADGVLILVWDTTAAVVARERLEQLAQQAEKHAAEMEAIIAHMAEGVMATAADGTVLLINQAGKDILGVPLPDGPVRPWDLMHLLNARHIDGRPVTVEEARVFWESPEPLVGLESMVRTPDGRDRVLRSSIAPFPGPGGARGGAVLIFEDITERRALETAREEFLAQASHELRTPLTSLLAYLQLAARRLAADPDAAERLRETVESATAQAQRLRELVNDLLDASRIRQGRLELRREPVDLVALVRRVVTEHWEAGPRRRHTFHITAPTISVLGEWDTERLRQVFANLIGNAIKYSPRGGSIWVGIEARGEEAVVWVRDEGIGIPEEDLPRLFRPFGRVEQAAARNIPGFGLGLYISRDIVERHGGRITVESTPGAGSTFTVILPRK
jgi:signal transduction histidine kinase/GAF domain-containing protein